MTKSKEIVLAAFLMASTSPMAFGQTTTETGTGTGTTTGSQTETTTGTGTGADTTTGTTTGTGTGMAATGGDMSEEGMEHRQLITMLSAASTTEQDWDSKFGNLSADAEVKIVKLSDLKQADDTAAPMLDQAMSDMEDGQDDLRSAIENHDNLKSAVEGEDYAVDDVVAAVVQPGIGNEVTLIVDAESDSASD